MGRALTRRAVREIAAGVSVLALVAPALGAEPAALSLRSSAFAPGSEIPQRHTCDGADVSPPLAWSDAPAGTRSFALVVDDPDAPDPRAPQQTWVHWVVYDVPASTREFAEGAGTTPGRAIGHEGRNDWKRTGWSGPCPPVGRHRYVFKVYALDVQLGDLGTPDKAALERALQGHVLARGELIGTYQRTR